MRIVRQRAEYKGCALRVRRLDLGTQLSNLALLNVLAEQTWRREGRAQERVTAADDLSTSGMNDHS